MSIEYKGIVELSNEDYHGERNHLSSSNLKTLLKNPAQFYQEKVLGNRREVSPKTQNTFDEGSYAHSLLLEPELISKEYRFFDGWRKAGRDWIEFKEENEGFTILSKPQKVRVERWVASANRLKVAKELLTGGKAEVSLFGELNGVPVKVRADYINVDKGYIVDVKTSGQGSAYESFKYTIKDFRYDLSAALYLKMFEEHYGKSFDFYFLVLDKKEDMCHIYKVSEDTRQTGYDDVLKALGVYKQRVKNNDWGLEENKKEELTVSDEYEILEI